MEIRKFLFSLSVIVQACKSDESGDQFSLLVENSYSEYKVLRVNISSWTDEVINEARRLEEADAMSILLLSPTRGVMDLMVSPQNLNIVMMMLDESKATFTIQTGDLGEMLKQQAEVRQTRLQTSDIETEAVSFHDSYHSYDDIVKRLETLEASHSDMAEVITLPAKKTYEGRDIKAMRITTDIKKNGLIDSKPVLWVDGGIHAREWIAPATMMYFIDVFLGEEEPERAGKVKEILEQHQIVIAPVINPDGYIYSCDGDSERAAKAGSSCDRMWRKTRKPSGCFDNKRMWYGGCLFQGCFGADPNRNWDASFDTKVGVSDNPCSDLYPGEKPFDQLCVDSVKTFLEDLKDKLVMYATYHSYTQLILLPWAYSEETPPHNEHHVRVGNLTATAIREVHGEDYEVVQVSEMFGKVSGSSVDWVYDTLNVVDAYGFELRPDINSNYGFLLPEVEIRPTGEENIAGLLVMMDNLYKDE
ncbi:hypothetical protein ACHWQZ_G011502 [Mnemiopsis leidyi]